MEYIEKKWTLPNGWDSWFTTNGVRHPDYLTAQNNGTPVGQAKSFLLQEQHNLCAYCQKELNENTASIEHVVPKSLNLPLSTVYHNLVAVCKNPPKDSEGRQHCDKARTDNALLPPIVFYHNARVEIFLPNSKGRNHAFFEARADGTFCEKNAANKHDREQARIFLEALNLNHEKLKEARKKVWDSIEAEARQHLGVQRTKFYKQELQRIYRDPNRPYRQYLLIRLAGKVGIN